MSREFSIWPDSSYIFLERKPNILWHETSMLSNNSTSSAFQQLWPIYELLKFYLMLISAKLFTKSLTSSALERYIQILLFEIRDANKTFWFIIHYQQLLYFLSSIEGNMIPCSFVGNVGVCWWVITEEWDTFDDWAWLCCWWSSWWEFQLSEICKFEEFIL